MPAVVGYLSGFQSKGEKKQTKKKHCLLSKLQEQWELRDWRHAFYICLCLLEDPEQRSLEDESDQYVSFLCMFYCRPHSYWRTVKTFKSVMKLLLWLRCWLVNNLSVNVWAEAGTSLVSRITSWRLIYPRWCSKQQSPGSVVVNLDPTYHNI